MSKTAVSVGLDYHPGSVRVCVLDDRGKVLANGTRPNSSEESDREPRAVGSRNPLRFHVRHVAAVTYRAARLCEI